MLFGYLMGYLAASPEERATAKGKRVVVLRLGVKSRVGGKDETIWCKCNIWHDRFDKMLPYLEKGSSVIVGGELSLESYLSREGTPRASLVVSVDSLKFAPTGMRKESSEESVVASQSHGAIGFNGESLDDSSLSEENMYANAGGGQQFLEEDLPF